MSQIPFQLIDWSQIERTEHPSTSGTSFWQTLQLEGLRIRLVEYSPGYLADHWCQVGHLVHCLEGSFITELISGEKRELSAGQSYIVSDDLSEHRSSTQDGVKLLIVDGEFLRAQEESKEPQ
ncbi:MAG: DHCW motif cupin fold protein [Saprospiraceae bacterium]